MVQKIDIANLKSIDVAGRKATLVSNLTWLEALALKQKLNQDMASLDFFNMMRHNLEPSCERFRYNNLGEKLPEEIQNTSDWFVNIGYQLGKPEHVMGKYVRAKIGDAIVSKVAKRFQRSVDRMVLCDNPQLVNWKGNLITDPNNMPRVMYLEFNGNVSETKDSLSRGYYGYAIEFGGVTYKAGLSFLDYSNDTGILRLSGKNSDGFYPEINRADQKASALYLAPEQDAAKNTAKEKFGFGRIDKSNCKYCLSFETQKISVNGEELTLGHCPSTDAYIKPEDMTETCYNCIMLEVKTTFVNGNEVLVCRCAEKENCSGQNEGSHRAFDVNLFVYGKLVPDTMENRKHAEEEHGARCDSSKLQRLRRAYFETHRQ